MGLQIKASAAARTHIAGLFQGRSVPANYEIEGTDASASARIITTDVYLALAYQ